jgi:hypothetical protein
MSVSSLSHWLLPIELLYGNGEGQGMRHALRGISQSEMHKMPVLSLRLILVGA